MKSTFDLTQKRGKTGAFRQIYHYCNLFSFLILLYFLAAETLYVSAGRNNVKSSQYRLFILPDS